MPYAVAAIFCLAALLMLAMLLALPFLIWTSRRRVRQQRQFAESRGWRFVDLRSRRDEVHWSGVWPDAARWRLISEYGDHNSSGRSHAALYVECEEVARQTWSFPEPPNLLWASVDADVLANMRGLLGYPLAPEPGDGLRTRVAKGLLGFWQGTIAGPQFRLLIDGATSEAPRAPAGRVLLSLPGVVPPAGLDNGLARLDRSRPSDPRERPWVLGGREALVVVFFWTLDAEAEIEQVVGAAEMIWRSMPRS